MIKPTKNWEIMPNASYSGHELYGHKVYVSRPVPKMQLSKDVPVSSEFRKEMDAWMLDFFGTWDIIPDGQVYTMEHFPRALFMNETTFHNLKQKLKEVEVLGNNYVK